MNNKTGNILWGIGLILAAVLLLGNGLGILELGDVGFFSLIMTLFFAVVFINGIRKVNFFEILFSLAFLGIIYDEMLGIEDITPWPILGAALLCTIGLDMIFGNVRKNKWRERHQRFASADSSNDNPDQTVAFGDNKSQTSDNVVSCNVKFGSAAKYVNAQAFESAEINVSFGEAKLYLDNAVLKTNRADIYVNVSFGDATIYLPKTWRVERSLSISMGDYKENGVQQYVEGGPVVYLTGSVSLGDVKVIFQ